MFESGDYELNETGKGSIDAVLNELVTDNVLSALTVSKEFNKKPKGRSDQGRRED